MDKESQNLEQSNVNETLNHDKLQSNKAIIKKGKNIF